MYGLWMFFETMIQQFQRIFIVRFNPRPAVENLPMDKVYHGRGMPWPTSLVDEVWEDEAVNDKPRAVSTWPMQVSVAHVGILGKTCTNKYKVWWTR